MLMLPIVGVGVGGWWCDDDIKRSVHCNNQISGLLVLRYLCNSHVSSPIRSQEVRCQVAPESWIHK